MDFLVLRTNNLLQEKHTQFMPV